MIQHILGMAICLIRCAEGRLHILGTHSTAGAIGIIIIIRGHSHAGCGILTHLMWLKPS